MSAELESISQPDPVRGRMEFDITGKIKQATVFGPSIELRRTIGGELGRSIIKITDQISNQGNIRVPHMVLYHCNFGWPLADEDADILWQGEWTSRSAADEKIFKKGGAFRKCKPVLPEHSGNGEAVAFIDAVPNHDGICSCGL